MKIKKTYDPKTGKTSWEFNKWYYKVYFWTGAILLWFYVVVFVLGVIAELLNY